MTILASLNRAYGRLPDAAPFGYSQQKIGFLISLNENGSVANLVHLRTGDGKKKLAPLMQVPQPTKRTAGIAPNFLWDKTSYVLGITAGEGKRVAEEHAAFKDRHLKALDDAEDVGLLALRQFLEAYWTPRRFDELGWTDELRDQNVVFALESERLRSGYIHDRPASKLLWTKLSAEGDKSSAVCLVTGDTGPIARLHPGVKGVWGAQSSGASIISFNLDAFTSYGHEQGDNAPVSEGAAFAYTTVLNKFLETGSKHRIQIGDASTVFWADASDVETAELADAIFGACFEVNEATQSEKVGAVLTRIRNGEAMQDIAPELGDGVRFYVLGLAPNAARLSIRYWFEDDFKVLADNFRHYFLDMSIAPPPRDGYPALWKYLAETAVLGKRENVPPNLAGEWLRAILTGSRYPHTLLATVLMRIRADKGVNALRVQMLKAILIRNFNKEVPVALDQENRNKGYVLGRLFAVYEQVQAAALGSKLNATIKDKFYGSASAQPRKVFALLDKGSANHLSKVGKQSPGWKVNLERGIAAIMDMIQPSDDPFPSSLSAEEQALFAVGYYHQRSEFFKSKQERALDNNTESDGAKS
jgi:CRISPR-associated protein Csd1